MKKEKNAGLIRALPFAIAACIGVTAFSTPVSAAGDAYDAVQEYTDTRQRSCILAVRADTFGGFCGEVVAVIRDEYGREETCRLDAANGYARNLKVAAGSYTVTAVEAEMDGTGFEVKRLASCLSVAEGEVTVCRLVVTDYKIAEEMETVPDGENIENENTEEKAMKQETGQMAGVKEKAGKKPFISRRFTLVLWLAAFGAAAGYWYLHYGRRKRGGR